MKLPTQLAVAVLAAGVAAGSGSESASEPGTQAIGDPLEAAVAAAAAASCADRPVAGEKQPRETQQGPEEQRPRQALRPRAQIDPSLTRAAKAFLRAVQERRAEPTAESLAFYASLEGADPSPNSGVATVTPASRADRAVGDLLPKSCAYDVVGVAAGAIGPDRALVAVLASPRPLELAPIPGRLQAGQSVQVQGRLLRSGLGRPRLYHLRPTGEVEEAPLPATAEGRFGLVVRLADRGEHAIEVLADGAGGPEVLALRRVFAGVDPPSAPPPQRAVPQGDDLSAIEADIASLRAARGLPPLERDPALDAVAAGHSRTMAQTRTFAHVLRADGAVRDRLERAGYSYLSAGENIGLADDARHAHEAIAQSPAHLANLLDPRHLRLGLGAVRGASPEGAPAVWLTEVLARPVIKVAEPAAVIAGVIEAERRRRRLPPLRHDAAIDLVARRELALLAQSGTRHPDQAMVERALAALPGAAELAAELSVGGEPDRAAAGRRASQRSWKSYGLDAGYARDDQGQEQLWLLLLFAK